MKALSRLPAPQGIAAMQAINVAVINPLFLLTFIGTAGACAVLAVWALLRWQSPGAPWQLTGSLLYLSLTMLVTFACNIPQNDGLAAVNPASPEGAQLWARLLPNWTAWNHVRTVGALGASTCFIIALTLLKRGS